MSELTATAILSFVVAAVMLGLAWGQPLPMPKQGQCPPSYTQSGGYCVPRTGATKQAIPKPPGRQCPTGWASSAHSCEKM